ncbi:MAG: LysM peptidoglycan-binding domain-containing protein [Desulfovibrionales bacterium]|nr:LysM peptidoglycan-binding domain-containing protein [Desulfovibrionales bacterium]
MDKSEAKMSNRGTDPDVEPEMELEQTSLLKKSEFTIIAGAALVVTALVCFFFFQYSDSPKEPVSAPRVDMALEKRLSVLEEALVKLKLDEQPPMGDVSKVIAPVKHKVARVEAAVMLKYDSLAERLARIEEKLDALQRKSVSNQAKGGSGPVKKLGGVSSGGTQTKKSLAPVAAPVKKPVVPKRKPVLHTVKKGETLWRISKQYKVSVARLRTLNSLGPNDSIHVGTHLIIR